jgi:hypothetical protein
MPTVYTEVEVDVSLSDFDTDDLIQELEDRGKMVDDSHTDSGTLVKQIYEKRKLGQEYEQELRALIYNVLGKIG